MKKETKKYEGWLNSNNFIKRVVAVTAYQMLGSFVVAAVMMVVFIVPVVVIIGVYTLSSSSDDIYHTEDETDLMEDLESEVDESLNSIYFDKETKEWRDDYGVCHTCTPENGFSLDGVETESYDYSENNKETSVNYRCDGELVKVKFSNTEPNTVSLFVSAKNKEVNLESIKTGSGEKYSNGDITFWIHQDEAVFSVRSMESSINCVKEVANISIDSTFSNKSD